jgi:hypothetical protein
MWKLGKFLVELRIRRVCEGVFNDKTLSSQERKVYVDALLHVCKKVLSG